MKKCMKLLICAGGALLLAGCSSKEKIDLEDLFSSIAIYAKGIYELAKLALGE